MRDARSGRVYVNAVVRALIYAQRVQRLSGGEVSSWHDVDLCRMHWHCAWGALQIDDKQMKSPREVAVTVAWWLRGLLREHVGTGYGSRVGGYFLLHVERRA